MKTTCLVALLLILSTRALAQTSDGTRFVPDVLKRTVLDPTTYAPATVAWSATRLDWKSSQIFFRNGFVENNPRFTVSGQRGDTAIGYEAGNRQILGDALMTLQNSVVNNVSSQVIERLLTKQYPTHRKLVRALGWIERSSLASYLTYRLSAGHFGQWQTNQRNLERLGFVK